MSAHTPGPWTIMENHRDGVTILVSAPDFGIAQVYTGLRHEGWAGARQGEANAHLIAAAPDLYEAIVFWLACLDNPPDRRPGPQIKATALLRKAIAKAEGR